MPPRFGSLDALKKKAEAAGSEDEEDDDEKKQKFYVGGTGRAGGGSGQNVIDPRKLMDKARADGAVSGAEHEGNSSSAFVGAGYSMSGSASEPAVNNDDPNKVKHQITFWRNGFSVDDGPLRVATEPDNQAFLKDINEGRVPTELAGNADPLVSLVSRTGQDYEAPAGAPAAAGFTGAGHSLGGGAAAASEAAGATQAPTFVVKVDEGLPTTTIQFRMHDATRHQQKFNLSDSVGSLYAFAASACPGLEFDLANSYPRKKLEDKSQSIEAAGLQNASLTQTLK